MHNILRYVGNKKIRDMSSVINNTINVFFLI